jgi:hypothetical protein
MTAPGTPRFRFRAPDGTEVPVGSVEDLSSRLEAGELGPETPLFDAGTGSWARAGDVPVFQFVLEELRAEGRLPQEEEVVVLPDPPPEDPIDPGAAFEPIRHDADTRKPLASPTVDPFELHLPLSNPMDPLEGRDPVRGPKPGAEPEPELGLEPDAPDEVREEVAEPADPGDPSEPWFEDRPLTEAEGEPARRSGGDGDTDVDVDADMEPGPGRADASPRQGSRAPGKAREVRAEADAATDAPLDPDIDPSPLHAWLTHGPPPPGGSVPQDRDPGARDRSSEAPEPRPPGGTPGEPPERRVGVPPAPPLPGADSGEGVQAPGQGSPLEIRTAWEDAADVEDPRAARLAARRRRRNVRVVAGMIAGAILLVGGVAIFTSTRSSGVSTAPDPFPAPVAGTADPDPSLTMNGVAPPSGLEGAAALLWRDLPAQVSGLVDSLRVDAGLPDAPPRDWLGGYYLANAGEFPEVVEFWERYRSFVGRLAEQDANLARSAARRAMEPGTRPEFDGLVGADRQRLVEYVAQRHERMRPARTDRFLHLQRTAEAALGLHDFLVENGSAITHSPALGQGVSADPVLEAVTETQAVRREMERHLDRIFEALDRTRGGGQPSLAGLRSELFGSLGRPL